MVLDLNRILLYADKQGNISSTPQRRFLSIIDGIVAGEGEGPLCPTPRAAGVLVGGANPLATDLVATRLMGFDYRKIRKFETALGLGDHQLFSGSPADISVVTNEPAWRAVVHEGSNHFLAFSPSKGWAGHIEI
jgi:uncharacterized protein (DUF362 family)